MTTLRVAPTQTRLQVLGEKTGTMNRGVTVPDFPKAKAPTPHDEAIKTRKRGLTTDKDLSPYYLRDTRPPDRRQKLSVSVIQTDMTEMEVANWKMEAAKRLSLPRDRMRDDGH